MIPRILLNHAGYIKKLVAVSACILLLERSQKMLEERIQERPGVLEERSEEVIRERTQERPEERQREKMETSAMKTTAKESKLVLLWNNYQMLGKEIYTTIFRRITDHQCPVTDCRFTTDRSLQNSSSAIIFHMPNLHWENYSYPEYRDPSVPWVFMSYESATNVRQRSSNWGRFPPIDWRRINHVFNRTMGFRRDSDVVVRHGYVERRTKPLTKEEVEATYSQEPRPDFSGYTYEGFRAGTAGPAPIAWFVSHCKAHSGRDKYMSWLAKWIGVDIYGRCGNLSCGAVKNMREEYSTEEDPCFHMVNKKYRFYISFENAICKDYITEKTYNALRLNTVPIVLGGVNYTAELPPHSYINAAEFVTPQALADFLYTLLRNESLYLEYFSWRADYRVHSFTSVPDPCHLCEKLHSGEWEERVTIPSMYDWFIQGSRCIFTRIVWTVAGFAESWRIAGERSA